MVNENWNGQVVAFFQEVQDKLDTIESSKDWRRAHVAARSARYWLGKALVLLAGLPRMVAIDELAGLPNEDLVKIFGGAFQALQKGNYPGAERAMLTVIIQAMVHHPDLALDISEAFPFQVYLDEPEDWGVTDPSEEWAV